MPDVSTIEDRHAGQQRLSCGCIVNPPGAREGLIVIEPCAALRPDYTRYRTTVRGLVLGDTAGRERAEAAWASVVEHVKVARRKPAVKRGREGA